MTEKETPKSPKIGGKGVEVSKTLFYFPATHDLLISVIFILQTICIW